MVIRERCRVQIDYGPDASQHYFTRESVPPTPNPRNPMKILFVDFTSIYLCTVIASKGRI